MLRARPIPSPKKKKKRASPVQKLRPRRPRPFAPRTEVIARGFGLVLGVLLALTSARAHATPASVVVEIDAAAERLVDARSTRRLVPLELSDVAVPAGRARGAPVLFFRLLGRPDRGLRIELWERGEYHGQRTLSSGTENPQLVARRVALAAAELGRRLARKREATLAREERQRALRAAREKEERERTREGPLALRSELWLGGVPERLTLLGTRLVGEISLKRALRLDLSAELAGGWLDGGRGSELAATLGGLRVGPARRFVLGSALDLDLGAGASALLLQVPGARSLDGVTDQTSAWTARLDASARFELRLSRQVRGALGAELGGLLRSVRYVGLESGDPLWLRGMWWGAGVGVVITPP
jgi:hypothetical protein